MFFKNATFENYKNFALSKAFQKLVFLTGVTHCYFSACGNKITLLITYTTKYRTNIVFSAHQNYCQSNIKLVKQSLNLVYFCLLANMRYKTSPVWNYFSYCGIGKYAVCQICNNPASLGSELKRNQTTSNLRRHLENVHKVDLEISSKFYEPKSTPEPILKGTVG